MRSIAICGLVFSGVLAGACTPTIVDYSARTHVVQPGETLQTIAWRHGVSAEDLARWNQLENPDLILVGQSLRLTPGGSTSGTTTPRSEPLPPPPSLPAPAWRWPVEGPLISTYGSSAGTGNGIGIGGEMGMDIRAAASGLVVYAGDGLVGYGQLIIIKHNDTYLSAYGHNNRLAVVEGDSVAQGQVIATMGMGPQRQPQLHFEIRRNGAPVDPLAQLPR